MNGGTVIGENTGVFVGGLPQGYTILRKDSGEFGESIEFICVSIIGAPLVAQR